MICFPAIKSRMPKGFFSLLLPGLLLLAGCGAAPGPGPGYPKERFLTAQGSGRSGTDACQQAMAQLAAIFEARISSDFSSTARSSLTPDQAETFASEMASRVQVASTVFLEGARILKTWQDEKTGEYHALAGLDRMAAGQTWQDALDGVESRIEAALTSGSSGPLFRLAALNRVLGLAAEQRVLQSRLRVVDFPEASDPEPDLLAVMAERSGLISGLKVYISISGEHGLAVGDALVQALTGQGIGFVAEPGQANVRVLGDVTVTDLDLGNPDAWFVRAVGNVLVFDDQTLFVQVSEKVRKAHKDPGEARFKAVDSLGAVLSLKLVQALGYE